MMYRCSIVVATLLCVPLAKGWAQSAVPPDTGVEALGAPLVPGDAIQLAFWREPQLGGDYPVDESGTVVLPLLGARTVTHLSPAALKRTLREDYARQIRNQEVRITLLRRVRILGAVKNPGLYRVDPTMTAVDVLALAGGATVQGNPKTLRLYRNGQRVSSHLDINSRLLPQVHSGDQIEVPERSWFARNGGYVVAATISALGIIVARVIP